MECPICGVKTSQAVINLHLDRGCPKTKKHKSEADAAPSIASGQEGSNGDKVIPRGQEIGQLQSSVAIGQSQGSTQNDTAGATRQANAKEPAHSLDDTEPARAPAARRAEGSWRRDKPLADEMRPTTLEDYVGQDHLLGEAGVLRQLITAKRLPSMILWGPSGVGKTTLARILARETRCRFVELSATSASVADVKRVIDEARNANRLGQSRTILFLDEIHRFNRAQQDTLLPAVEKGDIVLVGATTENPSFKLNSALLSRCQVFRLHPLDNSEVRALIDRAIARVGSDPVEPALVDYISATAGGDARAALKMLEIALSLPVHEIEQVKQALRHAVVYDQRGDQHYDLISAFHKSVRGGDADAAMYYVARMLQGGEDPLYISRRMVRIASEDVGVADDSCLPFCVATHTAAQQIGMPEVDVILAHCAVKLARAPKSVEVYKAFGLLKSELDSDAGLASAPVPMHLRNAATKLMSEFGYGDGYKYNPEFVGPVNQEYLPPHSTRWLGRWQPSKTDEDADIT